MLGLGAPPDQPSLFRFPYGACNRESLNAVGDAGLIAIQWDVSSGDPIKGLSASKMAEEVLRNIRPGSIVLFHANGRGWHTAEALRVIVPELKRRGYQFVTVTDLLNSKGARPLRTGECFDSHVGDTERYDALASRLEGAYQRFKERFRAMGTRPSGTEDGPLLKQIPQPERAAPPEPVNRANDDGQRRVPR